MSQVTDVALAASRDVGREHRKSEREAKSLFDVFV